MKKPRAELRVVASRRMAHRGSSRTVVRGGVSHWDPGTRSAPPLGAPPMVAAEAIECKQIHDPIR